MVPHHYEVHPGKPPCSLRGCFARAKRAGRLGVVEPVFANICVQKRMHRFMLRSKLKVDVQWPRTRFALVHNIGKIQAFGAIH